MKSPTLSFKGVDTNTGLFSTVDGIHFAKNGESEPVLTFRRDGTVDVHGDPERAIQAFADMVRGQHRH